MSLACDCDSDGADWYFTSADDFSVLATKRSRRCCSCRQKIPRGATVLEFTRWRDPSERCNFIEEQIYPDGVPLASWFACETCGGLFMAVSEAGMCYDPGENIRQQIREYRGTVGGAS